MRRIYETKQEAQNYIQFVTTFFMSNIFASLCNFSFMFHYFEKYCRNSRWLVWIMSMHAHLAAGWCGFVRQVGERSTKWWCPAAGRATVSTPCPLPHFFMCHKFLMDGCEIVNYAYFWVHMNITHGETLFLQLITWLKKITCEDIILLMYIQRIIVSLKKITCEGIFY